MALFRRVRSRSLPEAVTAGAASASSLRYWAFISYSSREKSWARWLHRAIETYGIPARLVGHPTPAGEPAPKRFQPLFHDRAELPASADLGAEIDGALRASRCLIVICSPHAARSSWVNKEVETFQALGRPGRVLAVIVDGEPNARDERECFPPALREAEPIAADVRPNGDGKGDAKLKLLAGMLGVGFDVLKQRDTSRRIRRLQAGVALASVLALGFGGLAAYAESQRIDAENQRNNAVKARQQAEATLEYLLYDLRDKLRAVGRLDIVEDAQKRVDAYYQQLGTDETNPRYLRNRAVALNNKGDRLLAQDDTAGALGEYRAAFSIMERLAYSDPRNPDLQRDLSVGHVKLGSVLQVQGDLAGALREYRAALAIREGLVSSNPSNAYWQWDLASAHNSVGVVLYLQGDLAGALGEHRVTLSIMVRLALSDPRNAEWQHDLAAAHGMVGNVLQAQGDFREALGEYRTALPIFEQLASSDAGNTPWQVALSVAHNNIGAVLEAQGNFEEALGEYRAALAIMERLASSDPTNADFRRDAFSIQTNIDRVLHAQ